MWHISLQKTFYLFGCYSIASDVIFLPSGPLVGVHAIISREPRRTRAQFEVLLRNTSHNIAGAHVCPLVTYYRALRPCNTYF